jgi:hypothetical protein
MNELTISTNEKEEMTSFLRRYGVSVAVVIASILLVAVLPTHSQSSSLFIILAAILFGAWYGGVGLGLPPPSSRLLGLLNLMEPRGSIAILLPRGPAAQPFVVTAIVGLFCLQSPSCPKCLARQQRTHPASRTDERGARRERARLARNSINSVAH